MDWHPLTGEQIDAAPVRSSSSRALQDEFASSSIEVQEGDTRANRGLLRLPSAPHTMSTQQLVNHLSSLAVPAPFPEGPSLPLDLVAALLQSLSARLAQSTTAKQRIIAMRRGEIAALCSLLREHSRGSVSEQLIERTLLRASNPSKATSKEPPDKNDKWELPYGQTELLEAEEDDDLGFQLAARPVNVIDAALDEAMSESAFDVRSDSSVLSSSLPAEMPVSVSDKQGGGRHRSIAARLLGLTSKLDKQRSPDSIHSLVDDTPPKSSSSIQGWAAGVFGNNPNKAETDSVKGEESKRLKRAGSNSSVASSSSASTTLGTSASSHPVESIRTSCMTSPPPSVAPSSSKANAVTALISKKQLGHAVLSVPAHPVPALSNPGSVQTSPLLSSFPNSTSRRSSASISGAVGSAIERSTSSEGLAAGEAEATSLKSQPASRAMSTTSIASSHLDDTERPSGQVSSTFGRYFGLLGGKSAATAGLQPTVTLPTVGLTTSKPIFQPALAAPAQPSSSVTGVGASNAAASTVELNTIVASDSRPPAFTATPDAHSMNQLVDRYGFLHEKNGMKVYRELRQRQQDKTDASSSKEISLEDAPDVEVEGANSIKRLVAQLDEVNETQEKAQLAKWDEFLRKRRARSSQPAYEASPARRDKSPNMNQASGAVLATTEAVAGEEDLWSDNIIGIARMGVSGKAGKEAWKDFKKLVRSGIPIAYRGSVWAELSGATDAREPGYYEELLGKHKDGQDNLCLKQINADVGRTFGSNIYFGGDGPGVAKLRRILVAYSWHNPEVGYCQGMNLVAGTLLLALPTEEDAFWILCCIIERILPSDYFTPSLLVSRADQRVLKALVARHLPQLNAHFEDLGVELEAVTFGWFLSLFSLPLPIRTLLRTFDVFFCDGVIALFRVALAILQLNAAEILAIDSASDMYVCLRTMTSTLHQADKLIKVACDFKVKTKEVIRLREQYVQELTVV